ncbi:MAG: GTP cyclohydrolase FolE2 [Gammaproteobacteria bacterium]|nr:GTP cyclohydrolase FolE2 [Gammaproteobacteria bacterium]
MDCETRRRAEGGIEDVQSLGDERRLAIESVGISGLRHPIEVRDRDTVQSTIATVRLAVELPAERRGTHMSRFIGLLMEQRDPLSATVLPTFMAGMAARLEAHGGEARFDFPWFVEKHAPVSELASFLDYDVSLSARLAGGECTVATEVAVPVTSLCPCSKKISRYGAHNQRSRIRVQVENAEEFALGELIALIEAQASAPLYGMLKREDEKFLTERAYDNPKFAEDTVRDVALACKRDGRFGTFRIEAENFESIHNHSAFALITGRCDRQGAA